MIKKIVSSLLIGVLIACTCAAQITDTATLRAYINANIVPNSTRSITATQLNTSLNGLLNVMPASGKNIFNTSGRITGNRLLSGYASSTSRYSMTFDTLANFEVHAYGGFGTFDPAYTGQRIVMNSGAGFMGMDWQNSAGRGAVNVSPGSASISGQQGVTDNRLALSIDGNKLLLTNPTTSGTNQLFQVDRAAGAVTLYGYPNTTGKVLSTDATGKVVLVDGPAGPTPSLQEVTDAGNISPNALALTALSGNIPTSGGNMLLLRQGDGEAYIESIDKPSNIKNPLNFNSSTHRINSNVLQYVREGGGLMFQADNSGVFLSPADATYSNTFALSAGQNSENITNIADNNSIQITRQPNYFNSSFTLNGTPSFSGSLNAQASHFHFNSIRNFTAPAADQQELTVSSDLAPSTTDKIFNIKYRPVGGSLSDVFTVDTLGKIDITRLTATNPTSGGTFNMDYLGSGPSAYPYLWSNGNLSVGSDPTGPAIGGQLYFSTTGPIGVNQSLGLPGGYRLVINGNVQSIGTGWYMDTLSITSSATLTAISNGTHKVNNSGSGTINITLPTATSDIYGRVFYFKIAKGGGVGGDAVNINGVPVDLGTGSKGPLAIVQVSGTGTAFQWEYLQGF